MKPQIALITGATSGIGKATASLFAQHGIALVLCGRNQTALKNLQETLGKHTKVLSLNFDLRDREAVCKAVEGLPPDFQNIDILINNAGNAHGLSTLQTGSVADWDAMIDTNVKGLLYITKAVLPVMIRRNHGSIVNIGSVAGKEVYAKGNVYCASKHAVNALNKAMRLDLNEYDIRVSAIHPGAVETNFSKVRFKGDETRAQKVYEGYTALQAADIADIIYFVMF